MMRGLITACTVMAAVVIPSGWDPIEPEDRLDQLEVRVEKLERQLREHDKTYHFVCDYEDCLTTNESLRTPKAQPVNPGRDWNPPNPCAGMCGGKAWWNGTDCVCPEEEWQD
jgi:hypothetical protein